MINGITQNGKWIYSKWWNGFTQNDKWKWTKCPNGSGQNDKPIPDINTDINTNINISDINPDINIPDINPDDIVTVSNETVCQTDVRLIAKSKWFPAREK